MLKAYWRGTNCLGTNHDHAVSSDATQVDANLWLHFTHHPVKTQTNKTTGQLERVFGTVNYWPSTGMMLVQIKKGATAFEMRSALATAQHPRTDPTAWSQHPCEDRKRISLYRHVDDEYMAEVSEVMFADLMQDEEREVLSCLEVEGGVAA